MEVDPQDHEEEASPPRISMQMANPGNFVQVLDPLRTKFHAPGSGSIMTTTNGMPNVSAAGDHTEGKQQQIGLETKMNQKPVKYRECLKNHAASMGGHALDGCGEFMPSGPEGAFEALKCAACDCHRNFHRKEVEGAEREHFIKGHRRLGAAGPLVLPAPPLASPPIALLPAPHSAAPPPSQMIMALGGPRSDFDHPHHNQQDAAGPPHPLLSPHAVTSFHHPASHGSFLRKRFRTKFTSEQKERMWDFAEKLGWRIQKHDEQAVSQFCTEIGVKRHVLKVWMHNNKNTLGSKAKPATS